MEKGKYNISILIVDYIIQGKNGRYFGEKVYRKKCRCDL